MSAFVGTKACQETELKTLLTQLETENSYYFLRWTHQVSGFIQTLPNPDSIPPEGQLFDQEKELRWQWKSNQFKLLLLSRTDFSTEFLPLKGNWQIRELNAVLRANETRFPNKIKGEKPDNLTQRYFLDAETATIHFIALTLI